MSHFQRTVAALGRSACTLALVAGLSAASAGLAPTAHADEGSLVPNRVTCGLATCTAYWSVDRTEEMHAEWKDTITGVGAVTAAGSAFGANLLARTPHSAPAGAAAGAAAVVIAARTLEFNHMINGAANDGRCLIYKFPRGATRSNPALALAGWFGSVHLNNDNCDQGPA